MQHEARGLLLVAGGEVAPTTALCAALAQEGYHAVGVSRPAEALRALERRDFDLLLCELMLPADDGVELWRRSLEISPSLPVILISPQTAIAAAVEAVKAGAFDYVLAPVTLEVLLPALARAVELGRLREENSRLREYIEHLSYESPRYQLVGSSPAMRKVRRLIERVAPTGATVLVRGPSGTGKELVARALHHNSDRAKSPLVTVNCAALQETLLESDLFGHEKGAFTGATQAKRGLFEVAEGGTLFIDEIAEMSPALQAKFLRVLEDGHYRRVGGTKEIRGDVRVIAATNKPLEEEQKAGRFREDLFYRLNVVTIQMPPLRERREDIGELIDHLLTTRQVGKTRRRISPEALAAMRGYHWPGNVRELANVLEQAQILSEDEVLTLGDLPEALRLTPPEGKPNGQQSLNLEAVECRAVKAALEQARGNKFQAARALGVSRRSVYRLIEKHGLESVLPFGEVHKGKEVFSP